jgi:hypothetical protein
MASEVFDPTPFVNPFCSLEEVMELKMVFDLFDLDHGGSIDPKGTPASI